MKHITAESFKWLCNGLSAQLLEDAEFRARLSNILGGERLQRVCDTIRFNTGAAHIPIARWVSDHWEWMK